MWLALSQAGWRLEHRGAEDTEDTENSLTRAIIGGAIQVHRALGPGLLESVYKECLARELALRRLEFVQECPVRLQYRGLALRSKLRLDFLVAGKVIVEAKAIASLEPVHTAQILTYLRLSRLRIGLLINFNVTVLSQGIRRVVNG